MISQSSQPTNQSQHQQPYIINLNTAQYASPFDYDAAPALDETCSTCIPPEEGTHVIKEAAEFWDAYAILKSVRAQIRKAGHRIVDEWIEQDQKRYIIHIIYV